MSSFNHLFEKKDETFNFVQSKKLFGERLKSIRKSKKLTMEQIQSNYPVTRQTISKLEKGEGTIKSLIIYLNSLDVADEFFQSFFKNYRSREEILNTIKPK